MIKFRCSAGKSILIKGLIGSTSFGLTALLACSALEAQNISIFEGTTPSINQPGAPEASYRLSSIEHLNYSTGHLNITIPLVDIPGRGNAKQILTVPIETHWWVLQEPYSHTCNGISGTLCPGTAYIPINTPWNADEPTYYSGILILRQTGDYCYSTGVQSPASLWQNTISRFTYISPDGTEHEFRDTGTNGEKEPSTLNSPQFNRGLTFQAFDGSDAIFTSSQSVYDQTGINCANTGPTPGAFDGSGSLQLRDGTQYTINSGYVTMIEDRNGNQLSLPLPEGYGSPASTYPLAIKDALGRTTNINAPSSTSQTITYPGFQGATETVTITFKPLSYFLQPQTLDVLFPSIPSCPSTDSTCSNSTTYDPLGLVQSVQYANNQQYTFSYDAYGDVTKIVLPTGGWYQYSYSPPIVPLYQTGGGLMTNGQQPTLVDSYVISIQLTEKDVYQSDGTKIQSILYSYQFGNNAVDCHVIYQDGSGNVLGVEDHYTYPVDSAPPLDGTTYANWNEGKEYQTVYTDTNGTTVLETDNFTWAQQYQWPQQSCSNTYCWWLATGYSGTYPAYNPQIIEKTVNMGTQTSMDCYSFDNYSNVTELDEYDYSSNASPLCSSPSTTAGPLIRATTTSYQYYTYAPPGAYILDMPTQKLVCAAAGSGCSQSAAAAETTYVYDSVAPQTETGIISYDTTNFGPSGINNLQRGNVTSITEYLNHAALAPSQRTYDVAGNIVTTVDPRGVQHNYSYSDSLNTYSLPTLIKSYTGLNGSGNVLQASATYDYNVAKATSTTDVNGNPTYYQYNDPLGRLTNVRRPDTGTTTITYFDTPGAVSVLTQADQNTSPDQAMKTVTFYDGLGREWETSKVAAWQGLSENIMVCKQYDGRNRVQSVSNPAFSSKTFSISSPMSDSSICGSNATMYAYDGRNREIQETAPDGSKTTRNYQTDPNSHTYQTLVIDPVLNNRLNYADAAGRLKEVDENTKSASYGNPSYATIQTAYAYDALDDLTLVCQNGTISSGSCSSGAQSRTFTFDSLKRMTNASNPESGTTSYTYDLSDNLVTRTDANSSQMTSTYDGLNRVTGKSYILGTGVQSTPVVSFLYGDGTISPPPPATCTNLKGRVYSVTAGSMVNTYCYQWAGKPTSNSQISNGNTYSLSYGYDLALEQTSYAFPSTRIQSTAYDTGGRVVSANGSYNGSSTTYGSTYGYFSDGTLANVTLGPSGQVQQYCQNNRLQIVGVRLGPAGGVNLTGGGLTNNCGSSSDVLNLTMTYGSAGANNGNLTGEGFAAPLSTSETFSYDAYNRIGLAYEGPNQGSNCTSWSQTYNYDAYGNRWVTAPCGFTLYQFTPESDAYTSNNQLPNTFNGAGYDNNGNQTAMGLFSFTYDAENRQYTSSIGGTVTQYTYDGEGRRVMKTTGDTQTVYVYDADGQVASEYSNVTPPYVGTLYLTGDHLGSTRAETNSAGAAQWYHDYLPFGEELLSGIGGRGSLYGPGDVDGTTHKFTSKERDAETGGSAAQGLDYFGARYMSSAQGRFTSADPYDINQEVSKARSFDQRQSLLNGYIGNPQVWNRYAYALNNPLRIVDLNGKCSKPSNQQDNQTGVCIEAFIATQTIGGIGKGDNRTFTGTDPSKTQRVRVDVTIDPGKDGAINANVSTARSETTIGLSAQGHTEMIPVSGTTDADGNRHFEVNFNGANGFAGLPGAPPCCIRADLNFSVTPGGQVSLDYGSSSITGFPSFGVYSYGTGSNGQPQVRTLVEAKEKDSSYLAKPNVSVPRP